MTSPFPAPVTSRIILALAVAATACLYPAFGGADAPAEDGEGYHYDPGGIAAAAAYAERHNGSALVVMSAGRILFEDYAGEAAGGQTPHRLASGTKSFWGVLAMAAVEDGLFTLDELVAETLTEWRDDPRKARIRVRHLLDFTSGLDPAEKLLRGAPKSADRFRRVLEVPAVDAPGTSFAYGPSHLSAFGAFLNRKLRAAGRSGDPLAYLRQRVLEPIGMRIGRWNRDAAGNPVMSAGAYVAPREWIKLGELLNKGGRWGERQLIDRSLLAQVFQGSAANPAYGLAIWLNRPGGALVPDGVQAQGLARPSAEPSGGRIYPAGLPDLAMAAGAGKQRLYVVPSRDLVIVRQGESRGSGWSDAAFLARVFSELRPRGDDARADVAPAPAPAKAADWRTVCAAEIERYCAEVPERRRPLRRCLRRHGLSPGCTAAVKAARRGAD